MDPHERRKRYKVLKDAEMRVSDALNHAIEEYDLEMEEVICILAELQLWWAERLASPMCHEEES